MRALVAAGLLALSACASQPADPAVAAAHQADAQRRADLRLQLASAYFAEGQYATALQELDQAYATGQRRADVLGLRALVLMQQGDAAGATRTLRRAVQEDPANPALLNNMGWLLCETGQRDEGLSYFARALSNKAYASPAKAMVNAGRCSLQAGKPAQAELFFRQALAADPSLVVAHANLARLAYAAGDHARAKAHLLRVLPSEQAAREDFLMAMSIERKLGDDLAEQSLARQWKKRFPETAGAVSTSIGDADER